MAEAVVASYLLLAKHVCVCVCGLTQHPCLHAKLVLHRADNDLLKCLKHAVF